VSRISSRRDGSGRLEILGPGGTVVASLGPNEWESRFFGRRLGGLTVGAEAAALDPEAWRDAISCLEDEADAHEIVQAHLDVRHLALAPALEEAGFRLVDTRIAFVTRARRDHAGHQDPRTGTLRLARPGDRASLLALAHQGLTHNPAFCSRYKDPAYFSPEESERWFAAWVENDLADPMSLVAVWEVDERPVGFFGYARRGEREGLPYYRGTLLAVAPERQGRKGQLAMDAYLYGQMPAEEFWVENVTQVTNVATFRNYLALGKRLDRIELTFYRRPASRPVVDAGASLDSQLLRSANPSSAEPVHGTVVPARDGAPVTLEVRRADGAVVATLQPNEWESRFFGRPIGRLTVPAETAAALEPAGWRAALSIVASGSDPYDLVQAHLDVRRLALAPALEDAGFRLVDTRASFVTRLDRRRLERHQPPIGEVRLATPEDRPDLLDLARRRLTDNPRIHSRYKDPAYFSREEAARWFAAWVESNFADPTGLVAVWRVEGRTVGFFGYQRQGDREGLPFYKSTVAAVEEAWGGRGAHVFLQTILFDGMAGDEVWVENTTQLPNVPIIHSHVLAGRRLDRIELTFFRTRPA